MQLLNEKLKSTKISKVAVTITLTSDFRGKKVWIICIFNISETFLKQFSII